MNKDNKMSAKAAFSMDAMKTSATTRIKKLIALILAVTLAVPAYAEPVVEYIHTDAFGTPLAVTDANGTVIERFEYEPYGLQVSGPVADGPGYAGHVEDVATGLTYMQQRYYDPGIGMFLSVDPVTAYEQPVGQFNRYRYANGNPYKFTDPDGQLATLVAVLVVVSLAAFGYAYWKAADKVEDKAEESSNLLEESRAKPGESLGDRFSRLQEDGFFEREQEHINEGVDAAAESLQELAPSTLPSTGGGVTASGEATSAVADAVISQLATPSNDDRNSRNDDIAEDIEQ